MRTFFTADPHFFHRKINELADRPWSTVEEMHEGLIARWNSVVRPEDWVYVLGDVCFQTGTPGNLEIVQRLNGVLLLVPGNHDKVHPMFGEERAASWRARYLRAGFSDVLPPEVQEIVGDRLVTLSHFPYEGDSHDEDRFVEWRPQDVGRFVLCGHVHGAWQQRGRQINVGVDAWNGFPVPAEEIAARIYAGPADKPAPAWQAA